VPPLEEQAAVALLVVQAAPEARIASAAVACWSIAHLLSQQAAAPSPSAAVASQP